MRYYLFAVGLLTSSLVLGEEIPRAIQIAEPSAAAQAPALEQVISRSKQFRVHGGDAFSRASAAFLAEETKDELLRLTDENDQWAGKVPITLRLFGKQGDPLPFRSFNTQLNHSEAGFHLRLDVHLSHGLEIERFKHAITACLIYERALRRTPPPSPDQPLSVPPWLVDGLREATDWRLDRSDRKLYAALFNHGGLFKIEELFSVSSNEFEEMDGAMRAAFRVTSGSLVMALLQQPQGKEGFRGFLADVASFEGEIPTLLRNHFPELNLSETSLAKWLELQLANKGGLNPLTEVLSIAQTDTALNEALKLHFRTPEGITFPKELAAWPELAALPEPERSAIVAPTQDALVRLSYRCFPSYRPILGEYKLLLTALTAQETTDFAARLTSIEGTRATMLAKASRARDYLAWFEITRAQQSSGAFDDYMRLQERLKSNPKLRSDDLSKYLDRLNAIFDRGCLPAQAPAAMEDSMEFPVSLDFPLPE